jgi:hypothetical protein
MTALTLAVLAGLGTFVACILLLSNGNRTAALDLTAPELPEPAPSAVPGQASSPANLGTTDPEATRAKAEFFEAVRRRVEQMQQQEQRLEPIPIDRLPARPRRVERPSGLDRKTFEAQIEAQPPLGVIVAIAIPEPAPLPPVLSAFFDSARALAHLPQSQYLLWFPGDPKPTLRRLERIVEDCWVDQLRTSPLGTNAALEPWIRWGAAETRLGAAESVATALAQAASRSWAVRELPESTRRTG